MKCVTNLGLLQYIPNNLKETRLLQLFLSRSLIILLQQTPACLPWFSLVERFEIIIFICGTDVCSSVINCNWIFALLHKKVRDEHFCWSCFIEASCKYKSKYKQTKKIEGNVRTCFRAFLVFLQQYGIRKTPKNPRFKKLASI